MIDTISVLDTPLIVTVSDFADNHINTILTEDLKET